MTADEMRRRLTQIRWHIGELEHLIRSKAETDPARMAIQRLHWLAQDLEFKLSPARPVTLRSAL